VFPGESSGDALPLCKRRGNVASVTIQNTMSTTQCECNHLTLAHDGHFKSHCKFDAACRAKHAQVLASSISRAKHGFGDQYTRAVIDQYVYGRELTRGAQWFYGDVKPFLPGVISHEEEDKDLVGLEATKPKKRLLWSRLRKRGAETRRLQALSAAAPGWWEDLPGNSPARRAIAFISALGKGAGVKLGANSLIQAEMDDKGNARTPLSVVRAEFSSEEDTRGLWVCPELLAHLLSVRLFRPISESVLASLRSRSRLWAKERGIGVMELVSFLPATLVWASLPMPDEVVALGALRGSAGQWSSEVLGALAKGQARPTSRGTGWVDVLANPLRALLGGGTKGSVLGGKSCATIQMPT